MYLIGSQKPKRTRKELSRKSLFADRLSFWQLLIVIGLTAIIARGLKFDVVYRALMQMAMHSQKIFANAEATSPWIPVVSELDVSDLDFEYRDDDTDM